MSIELITAPEGKPLKLNLGCGGRRMDGFVGIDIVKTEATDYEFDLGKPDWPLADGSVDEIKSWHFFEHLDGAERMVFMNEAYRVMKDLTKMEIIVPHWASMRSVQDPTHKWPPCAESTFLYFNKKYRADNLLTHYPITADFDFPYGYGLDPDVNSWNEERRNYAIKHLNNVVLDLHMTLWKRPADMPTTETAIGK